jgi:hypothetical protein
MNDETFAGSEIENVFRPVYRELSEKEQEVISEFKDDAYKLYCKIEGFSDPNNGRAMALAKTKLEESIMWAVKGLTK